MNVKQLLFPSGNSQIDAIEETLTASVHAAVPAGSTYALTTSLDNPNNLDPRILSNIWRIQQAADDPDMFYLDSDCKVNVWPVFNATGKPYFVETNIGKVGCFAFYVNGCTDFFSSILAEVQASKTPWTITDILNNHKKEVMVFPKSCISHYILSNTERGFSQYGDGTFGMKKLNGVWTVTR